MIRGTTPTLTFTIPFEPDNIDKLWITFSQNKTEVFTVEKDAVTFDGHDIAVRMSQKQTLALNGNSMVDIQIRLSFIGDPNDQDALASDIIRTSVEEILKDGEI